MKALSQEDSFHLCSAIGWIELGNPLEANEEIESISPSQRSHPEVLNVRLMVYALLKKWEHVSAIAAELCEKKPDSVFAWLVRANCLHHSGQTEEAIELLSCIAWKTTEYKVSFDLARYCCYLGLVDDARGWLENAFKLNSSKEVKLEALDDPYLDALWPMIQIT